MIREMEEKDYLQIIELGKILHENFERLYPLDKIKKTNYIHVLVYEKDNKIIGFLSYTELEGTVDLIDVVVEKDHRRQKIATCLIDYMLTNIHPLSNVFLEVSVNNKIALKMYDKFGFDIIQTRKHYYGEEDAYVMERVSPNE